MLETREREPQQTCKGTAEAKDIAGSAVQCPCIIETDPSEDALLLGRHMELQLQLAAPLARPMAQPHTFTRCEGIFHKDRASSSHIYLSI